MKSASYLAIFGAVLIAAVSPAWAGAKEVKLAKEACLEQAQEQFGADYDKIARTVLKGSRHTEVWIVKSEDDAAPRLYCKVKNKTGKILTLVELEDGSFRPKRNG